MGRVNRGKMGKRQGIEWFANQTTQRQGCEQGQETDRVDGLVSGKGKGLIELMG